MKSERFGHGRGTRPGARRKPPWSSGGGGCIGNIEPALRRGPARTISQLSFAAVLAACALFLAISTACAGRPTSNHTLTPVPTPTPTPGPQALLDQAIGQLQQLRYASFVLDQPQGTTELLPGLEMTRVYGVVANPDRFRFTVEAQVSGTYVETDMVVIADRVYMTNFFTGNWEEVGMELLPVNFANLGETLSAILGSIQSPSLSGAKSLGKRPMYVVQGRVLSDDLFGLVPNATPGFDVMLELWLEQSDGLLLKIVITGQVVYTDIVDAVRVLSLDDIDVPVEITPPL